MRDELQKLGLNFGYLINSTKSLLVVKEHCLEETQFIFEDTGIQVRVANSAVAYHEFTVLPLKGTTDKRLERKRLTSLSGML